MEPPRTEVGYQQFGTVGLDHGSSHIDEFSVDSGGIAFKGGIVAETSAERRPQGVDPEFRTFGNDFPHAGFDFGGVLRPADFVGKRHGVRIEVFGEERLPFGFEDINDRHVHHVVFVAGELRGDIRDGAFAFDQKLSGDSEFFRKILHQIVVLEAFVDIDHDAVFAEFQRFPKRRHAVRRSYAVARFEEAPPDGIIRDFGDETFARRRAVQRPVMADHQHAVGGQRKVDLHDVGTQADHRLDGRQRVFGIVTPVAAVAGDEDFPRGGVVDFSHDAFGPASGSGSRGRATPEKDKTQKKKKKESHIQFLLMVSLIEQLGVLGQQEYGIVERPMSFSGQ